ncbi:MAG: hypothetical protein V4692_14620, partial [Bdellovibrionota bacterium]
MSAQVFVNTDIAVIARASILPGSRTPEDFWARCMNQDHTIKDITFERMKPYFTDPADGENALISSRLACEISREDYWALAKKHGFVPSEVNRMFLYTFDVVDQLFNAMKPQDDGIRKDLIVGCMNPDSDYELELIRGHKDVYVEKLSSKTDPSDTTRLEAIRKVVETGIEEVSQQGHHFDGNFFTTDS